MREDDEELQPQQKKFNRQHAQFNAQINVEQAKAKIHLTKACQLLQAQQLHQAQFQSQQKKAFQSQQKKAHGKQQAASRAEAEALERKKAEIARAAEAEAQDRKKAETSRAEAQDLERKKAESARAEAKAEEKKAEAEAEKKAVTLAVAEAEDQESKKVETARAAEAETQERKKVETARVAEAEAQARKKTEVVEERFVFFCAEAQERKKTETARAAEAEAQKKAETQDRKKAEAARAAEAARKLTTLLVNYADTDDDDDDEEPTTVKTDTPESKRNRRKRKREEKEKIHAARDEEPPPVYSDTPRARQLRNRRKRKREEKIRALNESSELSDDDDDDEVSTGARIGSGTRYCLFEARIEDALLPLGSGALFARLPRPHLLQILAMATSVPRQHGSLATTCRLWAAVASDEPTAVALTAASVTREARSAMITAGVVAASATAAAEMPGAKHIPFESGSWCGQPSRAHRPSGLGVYSETAPYKKMRPFVLKIRSLSTSQNGVHGVSSSNIKKQKSSERYYARLSSFLLPGPNNAPPAKQVDGAVRGSLQGGTRDGALRDDLRRRLPLRGRNRKRRATRLRCFLFHRRLQK
jgi:hypothetical protein